MKLITGLMAIILSGPALGWTYGDLQDQWHRQYQARQLQLQRQQEMQQQQMMLQEMQEQTRIMRQQQQQQQQRWLQSPYYRNWGNNQ